MYFRYKQIKSTRQLQLVSSYRNAEGKPRQRIVATLGNAQLPTGEEKAIAKAVEQRLVGGGLLFDFQLSEEAAQWVDRIEKLATQTRSAALTDQPEKIDGVLVDEIETAGVVEYGPELVGMAAWNELGLTDLLSSLGMNHRAVSIAQMMVLNRLIEPLSERGLIHWLQQTALPEILDTRITLTTKDRLYKTSDELFSRKKIIEAFLRERETDLWSLQRSIVLYDMTNTHFEGLCKANPKAARGKNKQKRNDCPQVAVGMTFDGQGFPLAHEVFKGNIYEAHTLEKMLEKLEGGNDEKTKSMVIVDAGIATKDNLQMLKEKGYSYLVNVTRNSRSKYAQDFDQDGFSELEGRMPNERIWVKLIEDPDHPGQRLVLCKSAARANKEQAIISKAEAKFIEDVDNLGGQVSKGTIKDPVKIQKRIGKIHQRHSRVARFYQVDLVNGQLCIERKQESINQALELCGNYVLRTDESQLSAEQLWRLYMTLLKAESGFKMLKSDLGLRPNFHQIPKRVEGHIFITVLAYHLLCWIQTKLQNAGDRRHWSSIRRLLRTHCIQTILLPVEQGHTIAIRKPSRPEEEQVRLYKIFGIDFAGAYRTQKSIFRK